MIDLEERTVARGVWLYDGTGPPTIEYALSLPNSRDCFNEDEELDATTTIPETPDGFVYYVGATSGGEFHT